MRSLWSATSLKNIPSDSLLTNKDLNSAKKHLMNSFVSTDLNHLFNLQLQGVILKSVSSLLKKSEIVRWMHCILSLPEASFKFAHRACLNQLASASNLARWGRSLSNLCTLCIVQRHPDQQTCAIQLFSPLSPCPLHCQTRQHSIYSY